MVRVLFFGATADATGEREIALDNRDAEKAGDIFRQLREKYPKLDHHRLLYSINQSYASGDEVVQDGDELSVFTAVSGG